MKARIYISGIIGHDVKLLDIIRQVNSYSEVSELEVEINSKGGYVQEGKAIYKYLRSLNIPITTIAKEKVYSIASYIYLAGDERRATKDDSPQFLIHLPWSSVTGNSQKLDEVSAILKKIEKEFTQFYGEYTKLDEDSIMKLLNDETYLTADEAFDLNIVNILEEPFKACAMLEEEVQETKKENLMTKAEKFIKAFGEFLDGSVKSTTEEKVEVKNLVVQDATGAELIFPELEESESPEKGDKVMKGDQVIADETFTMPDGSKIVVKESVVEEVIPAPEDNESEEEETEQSEEANEEKASEEQEETKAEEEKEEEVDYLALLENFEQKITEKIEAKYEEREKTLKAEINALKKEVGSSIENEPTQTSKKTNSPKSGNSLTNALRRK